MASIISGEEKNKVAAYGWAARDSSGVVSPFHFSRRENGDNDITLKILYCGICHLDVHLVKNEFGNSIYPIVPGHEIVGEVIKIGGRVTKFRIGDIAGVGPMVGSCGTCSNCTEGFEVDCSKPIVTYNGHDRDGSVTYGGYSDKIVVDQHFAVVIPKGLPLEGAAPLMCAGITVYSPMVRHGLCQRGMHLGVAGLGGLGHVAVKFAKAFGVKVTVLSTSPAKKKEALEKLGADSFLLTTDPQQVKEATGTMDGIIDTISGHHSIPTLVDLLKRGGKLILVGASSTPLELPSLPLLVGRKMIVGSAAGGLEESQEMVDFAAKHNISAEIEVIPMDYVNTALERLANNDVRYRFVIDVANTLGAASIIPA